jgi:predicted ATP-binding protein involved in virulence
MRCYKNVVIDLEKEYGAFSLMLTGNNGRGKSAILRSIAMGLCDVASSGSLLREMLGDFIRKDKNENVRTATIMIDLKDEDKNGEATNYQVRTDIITNKKLGFEVVKQELSRTDKGKEKIFQQEEFPWDKIFVTAYGAGLRTEGTEDYGQYFAADAVYSLFKYSWPMQNPELIWRRLREVARDSKNGKSKKNNAEALVDKNIKDCLLDILNLSENSNSKASRNNVELENNGIFITSSWGKQELSALGDGYRCLTTMVMDIISWQLLMKNNEIILEELESHEERVWQPLGPFEKCSGIVIIDEIEKHLHPKLQRLVIKKLKDVFPKIQFIISSHSPLCVAGTADVENEYVLYRTRSENGNNCVERWAGSLSGLRTDQILEHFFEVPYINESTISDMEVYIDLYLKGKKRDKRQEQVFKKLNDKLGKTSQSAFLELKSKLLDEIINKQFKKIEKMINESND